MTKATEPAKPAKAEKSNTAKASPPAKKADTPAPTPGSNSKALAADQLRAIVAEVKRLKAERAEIDADLKQTMKGAREIGFDPKAIDLVIKQESMTAEEIQKAQDLEKQADLYAEVINPEMSEATQKGIQAASDGLPVNANPYTKKSPNHEKWLAAWQMQNVTMAATEKVSPKEQEKQTTEPSEEADKAA